jgi:hypothetical protein
MSQWWMLIIQGPYPVSCKSMSLQCPRVSKLHGILQLSEAPPKFYSTALTTSQLIHKFVHRSKKITAEKYDPIETVTRMGHAAAPVGNTSEFHLALHLAA